MKNSDTIKNKLVKMFECFDDSMLNSYFEGVYGTSVCDDLQAPAAAVIISGDFHYLAGTPDQKSADEIISLALDKPHAVFVPDNDRWFEPLDSACGGNLKKVERYHMRTAEKGFDRQTLSDIADNMKTLKFSDCELCAIGRPEYDECISSSWADSFVSNFSDYNEFEEHGFGFVIKHHGRIVSGTSTYCYYSKGVEVEVSTAPEYRRNGLASITAARFILECISRNLAPNWDARNMASVSIAKKLGFRLHDSYTAYEFSAPCQCLMPKDKFDVQAVNKLSEFSEDQLAPVIPQLLEWLQDMNWQTAPLVCELLCEHYRVVQPHLPALLMPAQTDDIWKYNIIKYLLSACCEYQPDERITSEIMRIADHPTDSERMEMVDEAAKEFLEDHS